MKSIITPEEIDLIKKAQAGNKPAFTRLFNMYKPFVDNLLYTYIKDKDEARDITNIVFLKVHEKLSQFTNYSTFGGWLRILTKNVAIDYLRTVKPNYSLQSDTTMCQTDEEYDDAENSYINKMTYEKIVEMFEHLPIWYKDVCKLFYINNLSIVQISEALNMPKGTIKSDLHRIRKILKKQLKNN